MVVYRSCAKGEGKEGLKDEQDHATFLRSPPSHRFSICLLVIFVTFTTLCYVGRHISKHSIVVTVVLVCGVTV